MESIEASKKRPPNTPVPAPTGNLRAVRHGANSEAVLSTRTADLAEALIGNYPWFLETDIVGIEQYCRSEARSRLLDDYVWELVDKDGVASVPGYLWGEVTKAENNAMRAADALGLTPVGRMKIAKDAGFAQHFKNEGVNRLSEQGRVLREAGKTPGSSPKAARG